MAEYLTPVVKEGSHVLESYLTCLSPIAVLVLLKLIITDVINRTNNASSRLK